VALYLADECVAAEVVQELRSDGLDILYAKEICPGSPDTEVLRLASQAGRILVTEDLGFGELAVRHKQRAAGIIILHLHELPSGARERYAARRVKELGDRARGHLSVVEPGRIRMRSLPR
jgi:predicted nuclease of predicted toxin-antitoxin system